MALPDGLVEGVVALTVGTVGKIIAIYPGGQGYAVELELPPGNPVLAVSLGHQVKLSS